jgi:hypothetical protein
MGERIGQITLVLSVVLLAMFFKAAARKGDRALIDLRLFRGKTFAAATVTQFMSNGISFAGQMLIPIYLIRACGRSPTATGWVQLSSTTTPVLRLECRVEQCEHCLPVAFGGRGIIDWRIPEHPAVFRLISLDPVIDAGLS